MNSPLVSCHWLQSQLTNPKLVVLYTCMADLATGSPAPIPEQFIPGSVLFDFESDITNKQSALPHTMPPASQFERQIRQLGINNDSIIVVYDNVGVFCSPRVWWMLTAMGLQHVAVLDGGLPEWQRQGLPVSPSLTLPRSAGNVSVQPLEYGFVDAEFVQEGCVSQSIMVVDARSAGRFSGKNPEPRPGLRSGHIPGSVNLPFADCTNNGKIHDTAALQAMFESFAGDSQQHLVFSCGSGVTACILALCAMLCGYQRISVYDGSWTEWGADLKYPIEQ
ncbi:sulfurtransferase [Aestuariibacter salexigens]|uniref:sulfurtransferase n=1 Tax=Aestuariibacter salexigens TaxID=226010 RepID=UPI00040DB74F|nr:sulfurtransferase [Aestuariibacter salexigens]